MTDKKIIKKRILIYLFFAFIPPWIIQFIYMAVIGRNTETAAYQLICSISMLFPAIGNFLTRIITKEGFRNNYLKVNLRGNVRYYLTAMFLPVIYSLLAGLIICLTVLPHGSLKMIIQNNTFLDMITTIIYLVTGSLIASLLAFGEEFGWRGYLTPKLEQMFGTPAALIVSGIIWGIWHAPITIIGHNFGIDYKFYPYSGIFVMCLFCIFIGIYFTALTKKTNSVYPAAIAHAGNNNIAGVIISMLLMSTSSSYDFSDDFGIITPFALVLSGSLVSIITAIIITKQIKPTH